MSTHYRKSDHSVEICHASTAACEEATTTMRARSEEFDAVTDCRREQ